MPSTFAEVTVLSADIGAVNTNNLGAKKDIESGSWSCCITHLFLPKRLQHRLSFKPQSASLTSLNGGGRRALVRLCAWDAHDRNHSAIDTVNALHFERRRVFHLSTLMMRELAAVLHMREIRRVLSDQCIR